MVSIRWTDYLRTVDFEVPYPKQKDRNYSVRFRDTILPAIIDVLEDENLQDRICSYPERRYIQRPGPAGGIMRLWEEYSSGDDWWDVQVSLASYDSSIHVLTSDPRRLLDQIML